MKLRKFLSILLLAVVALCFVACGKDNNKPVDNTEITEMIITFACLLIKNAS